MVRCVQGNRPQILRFLILATIHSDHETQTFGTQNCVQMYLPCNSFTHLSLIGTAFDHVPSLSDERCAGI